MIRITSKQEGFRRAGMAHSIKPKEYADDKFSKEQLAALKAEPMLIVEILEPNKTDEDLSLLTIAQLTKKISEFQPVEMLKGVKKVELIEILEAHREVKAAK